MLKKLKKVAENYGFKTKKVAKVSTVRYGTVECDSLQIKAKNVDGHWTTWFTICPDINGECPFVTGDNTDCTNIWLCNTRPDLKAEDLVAFFSEINEILGEEDNLLKTFVDPEDWQEISDVRDAYEDNRYMKCRLE